MEAPRLTFLRDGALLVEQPGLSDDEANAACVALGRALRAARPDGLFDAIAGARSLLLLFDPEKFAAEDRIEEITRAAVRQGSEDESRVHRIPVVYDGEDLAAVGQRSGLRAEEIASRHARASYRVAFVGFSPGFAYLSGLPQELATPRLPSPRARVPEGSVAIGGAWTGIYPSASPGGWRLIGRTSVRLFDPRSDPPALLRAGDRVAFEAVSPDRLSPPPAEPAQEPFGRPLFRVISPGLFTSVQGAPRPGLGSSGVPAGGAMDPLALAAANAFAGNGPGDAALEMTLAGPELELLEDAVLAAAGAPLEISIEGKPAPFGEAFRARAGQHVRCGRTTRGARTYLAVYGGLARGFPGEPTQRIARDEVLRSSALPAADAQPPRGGAPEIPEELRLRVVPGPEADRLPAAELQFFFGTPWRVSSESDRRGLRLEGHPLETAGEKEIAPTGMPPGTIELPGNGLPILLGPDGPVTGGYPRIAAVIGADLRLLGQARPGDALRFVAVSLHEAHLARSRMSLP